MFILDYLSALLLAVAFTVAFARIARGHNLRGWRNMPVSLWLLAFASWIGGMFLVGVGTTIALWLVIMLAIVCFIATAANRKSNLNQHVHANGRESGNNAHGVIALYFCVTLLMFFCAISLRSYIVNLS